MNQLAQIERLEAKLKLWVTPGFSQFLVDMDNYFYEGGNNIQDAAELYRKLYQGELNVLKDKQNKLKQTKLDL